MTINQNTQTQNTQTQNTEGTHFLSVLRRKAKKIKLLVLDVDGVLTDGRLYFDSNGIESKSFDTQDGHGIKMLQQSGVEVAIITGRTSFLVEKRAKDLGISLLMQGREDKKIALQELTQDKNLEPEQMAFVGDDLPDLAAIRYVGLGIAVANAHFYVRDHANWITKASGGRGAVREVCDFIMDAQNNLINMLEEYL